MLRIYKFLFIILFFSFGCLFFAEETSDATSKSKVVTETSTATTDEKKTDENTKEEEISEEEKNRETLEFGLESEITELLDTLTTEEDGNYADEIYNLFLSTKSVSVREKSITYFTKLKDKRLADYAVSLLEDPYDEKKSTVTLIFTYVSELEIKEACPAVVTLFKSENEDYFDGALSALGKVGGEEEALMLVEYLENEDLTTAQRQTLMRVIGQLKVLSTWDKLVEIIEDTDENSYVRMYAAEAIGAMQKEESIDVLVNLFEDTDPNLRLYALKGLENFSSKESIQVITQAIKDAYYKVRIEAIEAVKRLDIKESAAAIVYRAKNDPESVVKYACYDTLASLDTKEGNEYLISLVKDTKLGDTVRSKAAAALLEYGHAGKTEVIAATKEIVNDDKKKTLRYAFGKEIAKYEDNAFADICADFLASKDVSTKGIGLDMYDKNRFVSLTAKVQAIADDEKEGVSSKKAKRILSSKK